MAKDKWLRDRNILIDESCCDCRRALENPYDPFKPQYWTVEEQDPKVLYKTFWPVDYEGDSGGRVNKVLCLNVDTIALDDTGVVNWKLYHKQPCIKK